MTTRHGAPAQEPDGIHSAKITAVAVTAIVLFSLGTYWGATILERGGGSLREPAPAAKEIGRPEIGIVNQWAFSADPRGPLPLDRPGAPLGDYGWVDRQAGVIRIPVERAMDLVAQGKRP